MPPENVPTRPAVLIIDDELPYLDMLRTGLSKEFEIEVATDAVEAQTMMAARMYDIVVCDHLMPGEKGLDFLVRASSLHPSTRRILMTGYINPELLSRSIGVAKLTRCIIKPVGIAELAEAFRQAMTVPAA